MYLAYQSGQFAPSVAAVALFVLAMGLKRPPHRCGKIGLRSVTCYIGVDPPREFSGDLLQEPFIAVRVVEVGIAGELRRSGSGPSTAGFPGPAR